MEPVCVVCARLDTAASPQSIRSARISWPVTDILSNYAHTHTHPHTSDCHAWQTAHVGLGGHRRRRAGSLNVFEHVVAMSFGIKAKKIHQHNRGCVMELGRLWWWWWKIRCVEHCETRAGCVVGSMADIRRSSHTSNAISMQTSMAMAAFAQPVARCSVDWRVCARPCGAICIPHRSRNAARTHTHTHVQCVSVC